MEIQALIRLLDGSLPADETLRRWGLTDIPRGVRGLGELAAAGLTLDLLAALCRQWESQLTSVTQPDEVFAALVRFVVSARSPLSLAAMLERDKASCKTLLQALSLGLHVQEMLLEDPEAFDYLLATDGQPVTRAILEDLILGEAESLFDERALTEAFRRLARRETLRVAYSQVFHRYRVEFLLEQLSCVREALISGALHAAQSLVKQQLRRGTTARPLVEPAIAVLATGKLGGAASDYLTAADLFCVCDALPEDETGRRASLDFGERIIRTMLRLLGSESGEPAAAQLREIFPPEAGNVALVPIDLAAGYLDGYGRTWHRQQMVKSRAIAGDRVLGERFVGLLEPWIYRRYLSQADETGIQAVKRRLGNELRQRLTAEAFAAGNAGWRSAQPWITLLDEAVEYLQLLRGGDQLELRTSSTLTAIAHLEMASVISVPERTTLENCYLKLEELLLSGQLAEWGSQGNRTDSPVPVAVSWHQELQAVCRQLGEVLTPLLQEGPESDTTISREGDLLLTPMPTVQEVEEVFKAYRFERPLDAYAALQSLAVEPISFLSTRSCRHHLAQLADRLLVAVSETPDPDFTLDNLLRVSNSLGAKGVLWELFLQHPPSLKLYVKLCAASRYLSEILIRNPGMIDELVDALQLAHLPTAKRLQQELSALCRGKEDTLPILRTFKDAQHLKIGVRNLVGREPLTQTQQALTHVAELCLLHVLEIEYAKLVEKHGEPKQVHDDGSETACDYTVLISGKMGAHEPNYHSDLDILVVYAGEGHTVPRNKRGPSTTTQHFFTQLAQRVSKQISALTSQGRLYTVHSALASRGDSHVGAFSLEHLCELFGPEGTSLVTAAELLRARAIGGSPAFGDRAIVTLRQTLQQMPAPEKVPLALRQWRGEREADASPFNLKRGPGGTLDVEVLALAVPWMTGAADADVAGLSTGQVLSQYGESRLGLTAKETRELAALYESMRNVEAGLRLLNLSARHDLPQDALELAKLAMLVKAPDGAALNEDVMNCQTRNRAFLDRVLPPTN